jgi:hypothetical protein
MSSASPFEPWVLRALEKWPDVPALYGWLSLDRRGRWRIRGEIITRPQIVDTIGANYAADDAGRWFFQNGPQRGYMSLDYAPLVLRRDAQGRLHTHSGRVVQAPRAAYLDEAGAVVIDTEHGAALLDESELGWALEQLFDGEAAAGDEAVLGALALPSGAATRLVLRVGDARLPLRRLDCAAVPAALGFVREPRPDA